jgi:NAD(P)-dependent dehydrogenase (short-subunit alcohol dehydrogenase family)
MDLHLSGKTAVVTGTSKGIGFAITRALVDAGVHVVAASRSLGEGLPALQETGQVSFVPVDLSQPGAAEELVAVAAERAGIDILVNNVGGATVHPGGLVSLSDDEWQAAWDLNVMAAVRSTRAALPEIERVGTSALRITRGHCPDLPTPDHGRIHSFSCVSSI